MTKVNKNGSLHDSQRKKAYSKITPAATGSNPFGQVQLTRLGRKLALTRRDF